MTYREVSIVLIMLWYYKENESSMLRIVNMCTIKLFIMRLSVVFTVCINFSDNYQMHIIALLYLISFIFSHRILDLPFSIKYY